MDSIAKEFMAVIDQYWLSAVAAFGIFLVGYFTARLMRRMLRHLLQRSRVDETLIRFSCSTAYIAMLGVVVLAALSQLGIQTTSVIALFGAVGFAVAFSLKDSLSNFAAGVLLIAFHPFRMGDVIEAAGVVGVVEYVHIFTTQLKTGDNKTVIIPNGKLLADNVINYSVKGTRRIDLVIGVSYDDDLSRVKFVLADILANDSRVLQDPAPTIGVLALADSSINFAVRPWCRTADYWNLHFDLLQGIKERFDAEGISIPFPQRDLHLIREENVKESAA